MKSTPKPRKRCYAGVSASSSSSSSPSPSPSSSPSSSARAARVLLCNTIINGNVYKRNGGAGTWRAAMNSYRRERVAAANAALAAAIKADCECDRVLQVRF